MAHVFEMLVYSCCCCSIFFTDLLAVVIYAVAVVILVLRLLLTIVVVVVVVGVADDSPDVVAESEMASLSSVRFNCLLRSILQKLYNWKEKMKTISKRDGTANNGLNIQKKILPCICQTRKAGDRWYLFSIAI